MSTRICLGVASEERIGPFLKLTESYYCNQPVNIAAVVRWRHLTAPLGPSHTVELVDGDETVGRMWIGVHEWKVRGQIVRAANPCDFLIREEHRRLPAFMSLFKGTMNESQRIADFVYHTSNPITDDLYRKLMKLKPVAELDCALIPVRPFGAAKAAGVIRTGVFGLVADVAFAAIVGVVGWMSKMSGIRLGGPPSIVEQERIIGEFCAKEPICGTRSVAHRDWRHRGAGPIVYQEHWVSKSGRPIGYLLTSDRDLNGIKACFVVDAVLLGRPSRLTLWSTWFQIAALAASRGRHAVFFFFNRANPRLARLASLPMVQISRGRLPQQLPVFVRPSKNADAKLFDGVDWSCGYFVLSDFDMF